jgi:hypothetical protein
MLPAGPCILPWLLSMSPMLNIVCAWYPVLPTEQGAAAHAIASSTADMRAHTNSVPEHHTQSLQSVAAQYGERALP